MLHSLYGAQRILCGSARVKVDLPVMVHKQSWSEGRAGMAEAKVRQAPSSVVAQERANDRVERRNRHHSLPTMSSYKSSFI
ncbi:hypothetical protein D1872_255960 [compost metagenome]